MKQIVKGLVLAVLALSVPFCRADEPVLNRAFTQVGVTNGVAYLDFTAGTEANELFLLCGDEDAGTDAAAWDVMVDCGSIAPEMTHYEMNLPAAWGTTANILRFAFDADTGVPTKVANQLEYARFNTKQYVDLGIAFNTTSSDSGRSAEFKYYAPGGIDNTVVIGDIAYGGGISGNGLHFTEWNGNYYFGTGGGEVNSVGRVSVDTTVTNVVEYVKGLDKEIVIDGVIAYTFGSDNAGPTATKLGIGRRGAAQIIYSAGAFDFYYFKCWDANDNLISDVVPAINPATGAVEFYDDVTKSFLPPSGDELGAGPVLKAAVFSPSASDCGKPALSRNGEVAFLPTGCVVPVNVQSLGLDCSALTVTLAWGATEGVYAYSMTTNLALGVQELLIGEHVIPQHTTYAKLSGVDGEGQVTPEICFSFSAPGVLEDATVGVPRPLTLRETKDGIELVFPSNHLDRAETLYLLYGPVAGGAATNEWAQCVPIAEIAPDATNFVFAASDFPEGWGESTMAMRFVLGLDLALPSRYQTLEYAQFASGTAVDLGRPSAGECLRFAYEALEYVNDAHIFGSTAGANWAHWTEYSNRYYWGYQGQENGGAGAWAQGKHVVEYCKYMDDGKYHYFIDGKDLEKYGRSTSNGQNLMLGRRDGNANFTGRISYFLMDTAEGRPVARYYPVYDSEDGKVKFFETESQAEYKPLSGMLTRGPIIAAAISPDAAFSKAYVYAVSGEPVVRPAATAALVGGRLVIGGAIDSLGENTGVSVCVKYGTSAAELTTFTAAVVTNEAAELSFVLDALDPDPGMTYYFALVATGTDNGLAAESSVGSLKTPSGAKFTSDETTVSAVQTPFDVAAKLTGVGLGTCEVVALVNGEVVAGPVAVTEDGPVALTVDGLPLGSAARVKLRVVNTVKGVAVTNESTTVALVVKDDATYTWTGLGDGETWENAANWSGGTVYPRYLSTVKFTSGTKARVVVSSALTLHGLTVESGSVNGGETNLTEVTLVAGASEAEIRILSTGYQIDGIVADGNGNLLLNGSLYHARLTFDGLTVRDDRTHMGLTFYGDDGELAFVNGAKYFGDSGSDGVWIGWNGRGTRLVCDNATFYAKEICPGHSSNERENRGESMVIRGRSDVRANGYARYEPLQGGGMGPTDLLFELRGAEGARGAGLFGCLSGATTWPRTDSVSYLQVGGECWMPVRVSVVNSGTNKATWPRGRFKLVNWPDYGLSPEDIVFGSLPRPDMDYFYFTDAAGNEYRTAADVTEAGAKATALWVHLRQPGFAIIIR